VAVQLHESIQARADEDVAAKPVVDGPAYRRTTMSPSHRRPLSRSIGATAVAAVALAPLLLAQTAAADDVATSAVVEQRFDFGSGSSPVADGHTRVAHTTLYSAGAGYGLSRQVASRDRGAPDALRRDFTVGTTTFSTDLPDGTYWVTVTSGDQIARNLTELTVGGQPQRTLDASAGSFAEWAAAVEVADGRLDIGVARDGRLNGVTVSSQLPPAGLVSDVEVDGTQVSVNLSWEPRTDAVSYKVYRAIGGGETALVGETTTPSFADSDPAIRLGDELTYTVTQVNADGRESGPSEPLVIEAADEELDPPAAPANVRIEGAPDATSSNLLWDAVEGAVAYDVYRTDHESHAWQLIERTEATSSALDVGYGSECCFRWYYRVDAVGAGGVSEPSEPAEISRMIEATTVAEIDTSAAGGGARPWFGDLTGDGRSEIVMVQPHHINAGALYTGPKVAAITAYTVEGEQLWQVGEVDSRGRNNSQDIPAQVVDVDGDGDLEVVAVMYPDGDTEADGRFYVFDGATGEYVRDFALPHPEAHDTIVFVDADGEGHPDEILLKNRYSKVWLVASEGEVLWEHQGNTGHYPWPYDFDGDGRDEIMVGYDMLNADGELLWSADLPDHADTIWVADIDSDGTADVLLGGASTSAHRWDTGEIIWVNDDTVESQNIMVGEFRADLPGLETFGLDRIDRTSNGLDGLFMIDAQGNTVWKEQRQTRGCYGSIPEPIHNWTGDGTDQIMVWNRGCGEPTGIYSGEGDFVTELDDVRLWHVDICGDTKEEVIEYAMGSWLKVKANGECDLNAKITGEQRPQAKREYNFTRYTAGETPVVAVITSQPQSVAVAPGSTATFTVEAAGATGYQWQHLVRGEWKDLNRETSPTLTVRATVPDDGARYRVVVSGAEGAKPTPSDEVVLTVSPGRG
jgi:fibronectin type 3 domain-containing protein